MRIDQKPTFRRAYKKLPEKQRAEIDHAIRALMENPALGEMKIADLAGIRVHKFKMNRQLTLLAYTFKEQTPTLLALGQHENFYRNLKRLL
uniref:ParE-like toxin of type II toxin-antitoxin system n=1 Tax=Candidatus Kentrum sp. FM TaxID=2126340 RepID=A0A450S9K3_9GAMM|nr:MAG: ParE-like toxin of type II toxin-antitoxin system [Candidatus Kentron sp. FM]VFJ48710.1 MAG: ParE-like toxin of type II toxin-antitoxin system [Candidatus Kentron sp. FM]VFK07588.1 MAG: ParE-like toxin of type II toxin-antitoxin system [Candidatus Kentron sp. FM]